MAEVKKNITPLYKHPIVKYVGMEPESIVGVMGGARVYPSLVIIEPSLSP